MSAPDRPAYRVRPEQLTAWIEVLRKDRRVMAPVDRRGMRVLREVPDAASVTLAPGKTRWSPKEFLFPRSEPLFSYETNGDRMELHDPPAPAAPQVLFGVRPCDAAGLVRLDGVLLEDPFYARRRELTTVVAMGCSEAQPGCFCTAVGGSPAGEEGVDVLALPTGDGWVVRALTEKGEALTAPHRTEWAAAGPEDLDRARAETDKAAAAMKRPAIPVSWAERLERSFNDPRWNALAERCVGCSICAYVCPSCSCFDVADEGSDSCGTRCRTWDSCSFRQFTLHGSGHNPRPTQDSRSRQRVLHKFAYYPLQHGGPAMCVGCGRCVELCPVGMDIHEEVLTVMGEIPGEEATDAQG